MAEIPHVHTPNEPRSAPSDGPLAARVVGVHRAALRPLLTRAGVVSSGIFKAPVEGPVRLGVEGLEGDRQGDRVNHGGPDKAICVYPDEHYPYWSRRLRRPLRAADFGENLTTAGLDEQAVCIGDVFQLGTALVQVSQPRQPCHRLAARHTLPELASIVQQTGYTGWYLRVLEPGELMRGQAMTLVERRWPALTIAEANRVVHHAREDREAMERLLVPELSERWRARLLKRLHGETDERADAVRLHGTAAASEDAGRLRGAARP